MTRKKSSSKAWLRQHHADPYVQRAQREGYRSRACYKLLELQERECLIRPGMTVLDLGAAPGGWSQVAVKLVGDAGCVAASDLLRMEPIPGVAFVQGDFTDPEVFEQVAGLLGQGEADLVISDMAPNMSGMSAIDQPRSMCLVELALEMAQQVLRPGGCFVGKVFQGEGFEQLLEDCRAGFARVRTRKPAASRPGSRELYLVARDWRGMPVPEAGH